MGETMKVAIFGVGRWGVNLLRNFLQIPTATVVAIVDPHPPQLTQIQQQFSLDPDVYLTTDWLAALDLEGLDAAVIVTPATTHYDLIQAALNRGLHVLAEKPLTLSVPECVALCQLAERQNRQLVIDHTYLFHPVVQRGRAVMQAGSVGVPRYGYAARTNLGPVRYDVDALWDLAIHDIAIFNDWLREIPIAVSAQGTVWLQPRSQLLGSDSPMDLFPTGLSDLVWVTLKYPSGFQATIHLCWLNPDKQRRLCIVGDQGSLVFDELTATAPLTLHHGSFEVIDQRFVPVNVRTEALAVEPGEPLRQVCEHFLDCARHNQPSPLSSGWVGADLVRVLTGASQSLSQGGGWVTL